MKTNQPHTAKLSRFMGTWKVMVAGGAPLMGFVINLLLAVSATDLGVAYPRAGALYDYAADPSLRRVSPAGDHQPDMAAPDSRGL